MRSEGSYVCLIQRVCKRILLIRMFYSAQETVSERGILLPESLGPDLPLGVVGTVEEEEGLPANRASDARLGSVGWCF